MIRIPVHFCTAEAAESAEKIQKISANSACSAVRKYINTEGETTKNRAVRKIIGIIGGMGPAATVDLFQRLILATPASRDQEHLRILIDNNPAVPDRTAAILGRGDDPRPVLITMARRLVQMGAEVLGIPCNAAHYFYRDVQASVDVPILHMIRETAAHLVQTHPAVRRVGLLATTGTIHAGLYQKELAVLGLECLLPGGADQAKVMEAICGPQGVKAGHLSEPARSTFLAVGESLARQGAEALILGCTEIPLAVGPDDLPLPGIASTQALAEALVREALAMK